jgi:hypothetical protein
MASTRQERDGSLELPVEKLSRLPKKTDILPSVFA